MLGCGKEGFISVFMEFRNRGIINQSIDAIFMALLRKKKSHTNKIIDFRPISSVTCLYKIIAKVLMGCIQESFMKPFISHKELCGREF